METVVLHRMELKFVNNGRILLTVVESQIHYVGVGCVCQNCEFLCINGKEDIFHTKTVKNARYESLLADSLNHCFVTDFADAAFQFKMFHKNKIKMCYSSQEQAQDPLHQKPLWLLSGCKFNINNSFYKRCRHIPLERAIIGVKFFITRLGKIGGHSAIGLYIKAPISLHEPRSMRPVDHAKVKRFIKGEFFGFVYSGFYEDVAQIEEP